MKNINMEKYIISWGLPECLESNKSNIIFKFDDDGLNNTDRNGFYCKDGDVRFCLYDENKDKVLFSMDFFRSNRETPGKVTPRIGLVLLHVHMDSLRKKGIASYYFNKLREYAIKEHAKCIYVTANSEEKSFKKDNNKNALIQKELEDFYLKRDTPEMPVKLNAFHSQNA